MRAKALGSTCLVTPQWPHMEKKVEGQIRCSSVTLWRLFSVLSNSDRPREIRITNRILSRFPTSLANLLDAKLPKAP